ncbi:glycoside hydrolase family 3 N-terminal domain-containing protein [Microbulbifer thermotolerans]|uniref:glycoside hydrolase family 3 N-terminal domain-containing protein n=1 Tax=Microbulbifer thermotolerans TaxID=252514 RepID=UPI002249077F|nr:glycoside hydrolase family 3 N-terminal domain-containing protein [Microbulbifer thermotolerans]MCX2830946.1 glycoside hydrolase family 3 C-terminal domain-containing protein [Microbulbifer thermotolerans]
MKKYPIYIAAMAGLLSLAATLPLQAANESVATTQSHSQQNAIESRIQSLLAQMSVQEKIGQLALRDWGTFKAEDMKDIKQAIREGRVGGFLNVNFSSVDNNAFEELQRLAVEESPRGIPLLFGQDVIHGYETIFPIPLGQAASWNPELIRNGARIAAQEASADGIRWTFAPMIDISRDPRWGRIAETLGEDPLLTSILGVAMVEGFQTDNLSDPTSLAACGKHFAGYGAAEGGRDYNSAYIPERLLRDIYLPPFKAGIDAGMQSIMSTYSSLNDVPGTGSPFLFKQILRDEWGFDGFVVSDWNAVMEMIPHGYARDAKHAAALAANAGIDMEMHTDTYEQFLARLMDEGEFTEAQLDTAVANILRVKLRLGLWENPYPRAKTPAEREQIIRNDQFLNAAKEAAKETFVLLKNDKQLLPLKKGQTVALIGPLADAPHEQMGTWVYNGNKEHSRPLLPALRAMVGDKGKILYAAGLEYSRDTSTRGFKAAIKAAKKADVVLFVGGEEAILSGEGHSRGDIRLPGAQAQLLAELAKTGKPLAMVLMAGRPLQLDQTLEQADAVMMAWHPGTMAGPALAEVLYGETSPSGRLPLSWPVGAGQIPIYYNHLPTGRPATDDNYTRIEKIGREVFQHQPGNSSNLLDYGHKPLFPFGYGLTYSEFHYSELELSDSTLDADGQLHVSATITNTGKRTATETVQLYVRDLVGSVSRPVRELKGFERITLAPGESRRVSFTLKANQLAFHNAQMQQVIEPGEFHVWIAPDAESGLQGSFTLQ